MKVVLNTVSAKMGGAATYLRNLAQDLARRDLDADFIFVVPREQARAIDGLSPRLRVVATDAGQAAFWRRLWFDQIRLRRLLRRERADILFSTANMGMLHCPCPQVLLVRNALYFSQTYLENILARMNLRARLAIRIRRWWVCRSVASADLVITPSRSMLDELRRYAPGPAEKFRVIPYGTVPSRFQLAPPPDGSRHLRLLHISHYADHKNLSVLLQALGKLAAHGAADVSLSTTANVEDPRYVVSYCRAHDLSILTQPEIRARVHTLGDVSYERLPELYRRHDVFVFPSLAESYGHPLVEAMASGLPVVAADLPYARELCGEAALYFEPFSADELAAKIRQLAGDSLLRQELRRRGLQRVKGMTWQTHVDGLLKVFGELCRSRTN